MVLCSKPWGSVPASICLIPMAKPKWDSGVEKKFKPKISFILDVVAKQRKRGLLGERLISTFM